MSRYSDQDIAAANSAAVAARKAFAEFGEAMNACDAPKKLDITTGNPLWLAWINFVEKMSKLAEINPIDNSATEE